MDQTSQPFEREKELEIEIRTLLQQINPMRITSCRENEYFPEAREIAPLLPNCHSDVDVINAVHQVFIRFFSAPYDAGPLLRYEKSGREIWDVWLKFKGVTPQNESPTITALRLRATTGDLEVMLDFGAALGNGDGVLLP